MKLIPLAAQGAAVGVARDLTNYIPDRYFGGKNYPYFSAGELALGLIAAYFMPEPWDNVGLAITAFGAKDLTWCAMHWPVG
jgi:hypothetical protein